MQTLVIPSVPIDILRVIQKLSSVFQEMMIEIVRTRSSKSMSISRIAEGFFRKCGVICPGWPLCDVLFIRFFEKVAKAYLVGKAFILYASCFIVCLCLNDITGIVHLIIDLYVGIDKTKLNLEKCKLILNNILLNSAASLDFVEETYKKFLDYIAARNQMKGNLDSINETDEIETSYLQKFLCQSHPSLLWPVNMMHKQLQKFLYGTKFWEKSRSQYFFTFLNSKGIVTDCFVFVDVLFKIHSASSLKVNLDEIWNHGWIPDLGPISTTIAYDLFLAKHTRSGRSRLDKRLEEEKTTHPERIPSPLNIGMKTNNFNNNFNNNYNNSGNSSGSGSDSDSDNEDNIDHKRVSISRSTSPIPILSTSPPSPPSSSKSSLLTTSLASLSTPPPPIISSLPPSPSQLNLNSSIKSLQSLKDLRILVIEDSMFQRKLIVRGLMKCLGEELTDYEDKWPVVSIGNGEEAFKLLESQRYDIFIVDENLDGTGGILKGHEVIAHLRRYPHLQEAIIIGCTSNVNNHREAFLSAGANTVWSKPIPNPTILQEDLKTLLNQRMGKLSIPSPHSLPLLPSPSSSSSSPLLTPSTFFSNEGNYKN